MQWYDIAELHLLFDFRTSFCLILFLLLFNINCNFLEICFTTCFLFLKICALLKYDGDCSFAICLLMTTFLHDFSECESKSNDVKPNKSYLAYCNLSNFVFYSFTSFIWFLYTCSRWSSSSGNQMTEILLLFT